MKNPCETCLVRSVCTSICDEIISYSREVIGQTDFESITNWLCKYEMRPRILDKYNIRKNKYKNGKPLSNLLGQTSL